MCYCKLRKSHEWDNYVMIKGCIIISSHAFVCNFGTTKVF